MKHILFTLSLFALFQIGTAQETWNACNSTVTVIPTPSYDSTFVLSAPSRAALAKGMANWTPATSGGASYLVYTALLTQTGTDAPVATVLENTLGGAVVWSYIDAGNYYATLSGAFTANKTFISQIIVNDGGAVLASADRANNNLIEIVLPNNNLLINTPFEIRVYP